MPNLVGFEVKAEVFTVYIPLGNKVGFRLQAVFWSTLIRGFRMTSFKGDFLMAAYVVVNYDVD